MTTEEDGNKGLAARKRMVVIGIAVAGVVLAAVVGTVLGRGVRRKGSAGMEAALRIVAAYSDSLHSLRKAQLATADPAKLAGLAAKERRLRVLTAVGLGGVLRRSGESELRDEIEDEIREILSAFSNAGDVLEEIEGPYFQGLAHDDPDFARDLTGLLEFLVREGNRGIEEKRRELEELKAQEAEIREKLVPGGDKREGHEGHGHE